jgi:tetratricopeptide (TPR) repeat protein
MIHFRIHSLIIIFLLIGLSTKAQKFSVESMKMELEDMTKPDSDRDYENLLKWAEQTKVNPKTANSPKMWYYRGLTFLKISTLNNEFSQQNPDAILTALEAFQNAISTDVKNKVTKEAKANLLNVAIGLYNRAYGSYQSQNYAEAYKEFELAVPLMKYDTDGLLKRNNLTQEVLEQMMGYSAMNDGNDENAKKVFQKLIDGGTAESNIYASLARLHLNSGDTTAALNTITTGKEFNETDKTLINMELDIFLKQGRSKELIEKLSVAIADDPGNTIYYFARAISFEGLNETEKAAADYDKILEIDPTYYDAAYNKGVMYLGKVAKIVDELDGEYKPSIIEKKEAEIYVQYELAIVEFENVFDNNADMEASDKLELAKTMKKIYARLKKMDKYKEMKDYIDNN